MEKTLITCEDGYRLTGHFFRAATESPRGAVLLSPATGFRHQVYFNFATMLSEQGFAVLAFSNRGIGDSRNDTPPGGTLCRPGGLGDPGFAGSAGPADRPGSESAGDPGGPQCRCAVDRFDAQFRPN